MSTHVKSATTEAASMGHAQRTIASTVGGTRVTAAATTGRFGVRIKARPDNTEAVYIGLSGVTTANGYPLSAGEELAIPVGNANDIFAICASGGQNLCLLWC